MSFFIFQKNNNTSLYRIAENSNELNNQNIVLSHYDVVEENNQTNFLNIVLCKKYVLKHENNIIEYGVPNIKESFENKKYLDIYIKDVKSFIKKFLDTNLNNPLFPKWNNYYNQLSSLDTNNISFPLDMSLEEYFYNSNLPVLNTLQLP